MIRDTQKILKQLRQEYHAQKVAFEQAGANINLFTKSVNFSTQQNLVSQTQSGSTFSYPGEERVVVTLTTNSGSNTLAKLEVSGNYDTVPIVRRVPFSGGAKWVVTSSPRLVGGNWASTTYTFVVQTLVNGTLSAKMIWS